jgi:glyoxylase-like metal-dependent hydrolase (beta-lactamase superfamily II)
MKEDEGHHEGGAGSSVPGALWARQGAAPAPKGHPGHPHGAVLLPGARPDARHGQQTARALEELRRPEHKLQVTDLALPLGDRMVSLIGIMDLDPQRSLGDYQNTGYFLLVEGAPQTSHLSHPPHPGLPPGLKECGAQVIKAVVIDPGLRDGDWIRATLGISRCEVFFTHFHLDHWIGYESYRGQPFYASPLCKTVLTQMAGAERTGKSIFVEGRLTDYHRSPLPIRAANDAERLLPIREKIRPVTGDEPYRNDLFGLDFFELPYGQTEGTLYGLLEAGGVKVLFASDLFVCINGQFKIEPHYAFKPKRMVIEDITVMLRALLGKDPPVTEDAIANANLARVAGPDLLAMGHGLLDFESNRPAIAHLLEELEELIRINREHII